jgi:hypothetical protein
MADENVHEKSVFVKINEYKDVIALFDQLRTKLQKARETLNKVIELKKEEETEIELWHNSVTEIENKLAFIDRRLGGAE